MIGGKLTGIIVRKIQKIIRRGLYTPLTNTRDMMVNGVIVSKYVAILDHDWIWHQHLIGHILFFLPHTFCRCFLEACKKENYIHGYGYLAYVIIHGSSIVQSGLWMRKWVLLVVIGFLVGIVAHIRISTVIAKGKE
jgi:hypothetical protein